MLFNENSQAKTTVDAYATISTIDRRGKGQGVLMLSNSGATNTLTYQILGYAHSAGTLYKVIETDDLAPAAKTIIDLVSVGYAKIVVQVKSKVSAAHTTSLCEWCIGE